MAQKIITQSIDLRRQDGRDVILFPDVLAVKGDNKAHLWRVELYDDGKPLNLTGQTALCTVVNGGNTVTLSANTSGNVASAEFNSYCYAHAGTMRCMMSVAAAGQAPTLAMLCLRVKDGGTDVIINPDDIIPSLSALLALVDDLADAATAEAARISAESARASAEGGRTSAETARAQAEQLRASAETMRQSKETTRSSLEQTRQSNESTRQSKETARQSAESTRSSSEQTRQSNESTRQSKESERQSAETTRRSQESDRQSSTAAAIRSINTATDAAGKATAGANAAAKAANTASASATAAADAIDGMTVSAKDVPAGGSASAMISEVGGHKHIEFGLRQGERG
ncbi:MAG: hypothetical protein RSC06_07065, partial [Clostridia bacterium]